MAVIYEHFLTFQEEIHNIGRLKTKAKRGNIKSKKNKFHFSRGTIFERYPQYKIILKRLPPLKYDFFFHDNRTQWTFI